MSKQCRLWLSLLGRQHTTGGHLGNHGLSDVRSAIVDAVSPSGMGIDASPDKEREV